MWVHNTRVDLAEDPVAVLVVTHGYGEHLGRFDEFAQRALEQGISVLRANLAGHGEGSGYCADITDFGEYQDQLSSRIAEARAYYKELPIFAFGHSFGSFITAWFASEHPGAVDGYIFSGGLVDNSAAPKLKVLATKLLSGVVPKLRIPVGVDVELISSDHDQVIRYKSDPLTFDRATLRWGRILMQALQRFADKPKWTTRSLWLHGEADEITPLKPVENYVSGEKCWELKVYANNRHEVHHDSLADAFYTDLFEFVKADNSQR